MRASFDGTIQSLIAKAVTCESQVRYWYRLTGAIAPPGQEGRLLRCAR